MIEIIKFVIELLGSGVSIARLVFDILKWKNATEPESKKQPQIHRKKPRKRHRKKRREKAPRGATRKRA